MSHDDAVRLAREFLDLNPDSVGIVHDLSRALLALHAENERLRAALKLAGTSVDDAYQHRSEHARLLYSDVDQGKRVADLLREIGTAKLQRAELANDCDRLREALGTALDGWSNNRRLYLAGFLLRDDLDGEMLAITELRKPLEGK